MRVLLMGDASNYHATLARGLRVLGHEVTVASDGTAWMRTARDIDLSRRFPGKFGGLELYARLLVHPSKFRGFDVVAVHTPFFLSLKPSRIRRIFDLLLSGNRSVFLTALGTDPFYVRECLRADSPIKFSEFRLPGCTVTPYVAEHPGIIEEWTAQYMMEHCAYVYGKVHGVVSALYEYDVMVRRHFDSSQVAYGGIPIDTGAISPVELPERPDRIRLMLGRHKNRLTEKGTNRLEIAARRAIERHPGKAELVVVENRPYNEFLELLKSSHVVIDQAYSYTPATTALLGMAYGIPAVSGAEPEFYDFIGEKNNRPIFRCPTDVDGMTRMFEDIITHPQDLIVRGRASRDFVEKHNDFLVVARRFLNHWEKFLNV